MTVPGAGESDVVLARNNSFKKEDEEALPPSKRTSDYHILGDHVIQPHSELPKPEPPRGLFLRPLPPLPSPPPTALRHVDDVVPTIKTFIKQRSASIGKRLSLLTKEGEGRDGVGDDHHHHNKALISLTTNPDVTEFNLSGMKVIVRAVKNDSNAGEEPVKGRISFFSRSNCRDCTAVRSFFREKGLRFVEINVDVYPQRRKDLVERTGAEEVPRIFFNDKLIGGLVALNSLRNSGELNRRMREMLGSKCNGDAPAVPMYGFDDVDGEEEEDDEALAVVRVLRQRLPIQDRLMKMKIVHNCFSGNEMVEVLVHYLDCGRAKAIEVGKHLAKRHFIHHVFGQNDFEAGNHYYRFLEHEPYISRCYNFRGSTNDSEPKPATVVSSRLHKIMSAILESYTSDDRRHVDYAAISKSEEFRRYVNLVQHLQRVDLQKLGADERLAFFLNMYNAMVIHAVTRIGCSKGVMDRRTFYSDFQYIIGGHPYSLNAIKNGILRSNRRSPYSFVKPFGGGDKRLELCVGKVNPLIHFGLCNGTRSSPTVRFFTPQGVETELRQATRDFFQGGGVEVDLEHRSLHLSRIINWFSCDFGQEKEIVTWIENYLDPNRAGLLTHLLRDGDPINIVYQDYNWSVNS